MKVEIRNRKGKESNKKGTLVYSEKCESTMQSTSTQSYDKSFSPLKFKKLRSRRDLHKRHKKSMVRDNKALEDLKKDLNSSYDLTNAYKEKSREENKGIDKYLMYRSSFIPSVFVKRYTGSGIFPSNKVWTDKDMAPMCQLHKKSHAYLQKNKMWQKSLLKKLKNRKEIGKKNKTIDFDVSPSKCSFVRISSPIKDGSSFIKEFIRQRAALQNNLKGRNQVLNNSLKVRRIDNESIEFQNDVIKKRTASNHCLVTRSKETSISPHRKALKLNYIQKSFKSQERSSVTLKIKDVESCPWETKYDCDTTFYDYNDQHKYGDA
ncbi:unnamed protein product [Moneuplotes crassus]|uniref:Uncharacterized protein n=1 Tax=Euplotes crassus TaxID=5936 RepID=A0AAD1UJV3_EUPCR|nr:unnamed protein product [Moneuplotes crassus]